MSCARTNGRERDATARQAETVLKYKIQHPPTRGLVRSSRGVDVATDQRYHLVFIRLHAPGTIYRIQYKRGACTSGKKMIAIGEKEASEYKNWESELNSIAPHQCFPP
jgi:hypothetical protein